MFMVVEYHVHADEDDYVTAFARSHRQLWWYRWSSGHWLDCVDGIDLLSNGALADWPSIGLFFFCFSVPLGCFLRHLTGRFPPPHPQNPDTQR